MFEERTEGSLEVGKLVDFVILLQDPTNIEPTTIADIRVTETVKEGITVFRLTAAGGKTARDAVGDALGRLLLVMAHATPMAVAMGSPGFARLLAQVPAKRPPDNDQQFNGPQTHVFGNHLVHRQVVVQQGEAAQSQLALRRHDRYRHAMGLNTFASLGHALALWATR